MLAILFSVTFQNCFSVCVDASVAEERPATTYVFCSVKVNLNHLYAFLIVAELIKELTLRACGE
jgi:hypothetical protein